MQEANLAGKNRHEKTRDNWGRRVGKEKKAILSGIRAYTKHKALRIRRDGFLKKLKKTLTGMSPYVTRENDGTARYPKQESRPKLRFEEEVNSPCSQGDGHQKPLGTRKKDIATR
ncbi:MAG: hypothetical protein A2900_00300 [Candidatus Chisholmbacteria bacterium RIFCSPLOWO2_01_FULL_50_28]|uniref:Uncharacterized protein n=1 Tax=Candidatus Chisholmbacteria bacterium RIFCSPHIGHO2_01_FULL_52_32 TaxID=1797591 RepID=A0A1G1VQY4_9BACT|nr:MAG: hypothetical protein A2786_00645 [Candidatus Chisholmbacteria bacterium RIFCSPHIGHO2_01_FULL_52_32]OGY19545.1 MAG: hypothetical protein A2900_00300 [Candidatus Chisholmbacteria bacterium RIFCSPLOWO2_01_FULL_50_28]